MIRLGSTSPVRAAILKEHGIDFMQSGCNFDEEQITTKNPKSFVYAAAMGKYQACYKEHGDDLPLLIADTVVTSQGLLLRKAKDREDAKKILLTQSGNTTSILTCTIFKTKELQIIDLSATDYLFEKFDEADLESYLDSNEWQGKAGACMVEGFCKKYIKSVHGTQNCAMGLSIEKILPYIRVLQEVYLKTLKLSL